MQNVITEGNENDNVLSSDSLDSTVKPISESILKLNSWLNKALRIEMSDGRVLIGVFLCTDRDANIILGSCSEYLPDEIEGSECSEEPRMLGLVMVPGKHIVSICIEKTEQNPKPTSSSNSIT